MLRREFLGLLALGCGDDMASYPSSPNKYPGTPKAYPASPKAYPASPNAFPGAAAAAMTPAQFTAAMLAGTTRTNIWLVHGDAGVNQATISGRVSSLTSQGGANDWTTLGATQEPTYTAADSTLNDKGTWTLDGSAKYMLNAYDAPAPLTQPHYRISVVKVNSWLGGRVMTEMAAAIGFGLVSDGTNRYVAHSANTTVGGDLDFPNLQWCIVEEYFSGSTSDFTIVGPLDNIATGVNLGNTNPASLGMGGSRTGTLLSSTSHAFSAAYLGLPTPTERATMRTTLSSNYGSQLLRTRKICRYLCGGDSITLDVLGTELWRRAIANTFFYGLGYPAFSVGSTASGSYDGSFTRHCGVTGQTIAGYSTFMLDPTTGQLRSGGPLTGQVQLLLTMIGTNDMPTYVAGTTAAAYRTLLDGLQAAVPTVRQVVTKIIPRNDANNANVILFNAELPAVWDAFDAANPGKELIRWDANTAIGGPNYVAANYGDNLHPNATGSALLGAAVSAAIATIMNTLTTF